MAIQGLRPQSALCLSCWVRRQGCVQGQTIRSKSTRSAINLGLNATANFTNRRVQSQKQFENPRLRRRPSPVEQGAAEEPLRRTQNQSVPRGKYRGSTGSANLPTANRRQSRQDSQETRRNGNQNSKSDYEIPLSIPHTTAASQFLYGNNVVIAALRSQRRKLYRLYTLPRISAEDPEHHFGSNARRRPTENPTSDVIVLAKAAKVPLKSESNVALLDKMSSGRPHNGVVLEASTIPAPPVSSLGKPDYRKALIPLSVDRQSAEETAVNGAPSSIPLGGASWRHPLVVLLDGITDPENIGSILRSCHFYGVDAVAVATNTCATLASPVLAKASSGACEAVRLLALPRPSEFVYESARAGWEIYAAVAPAAPHLPPSSPEVSRQMSTMALSAESPLARKPCIMMLGSEGLGLRENLRRRANFFVTIERGAGPSDTPNVGVDSMNVGVAAGVLLEAFMRKPASAPAKKETAGDLGW